MWQPEKGGSLTNYTRKGSEMDLASCQERARKEPWLEQSRQVAKYQEMGVREAIQSQVT